MGKKPVDSIVRAQAVALSDSGLNQVQISRQLKISRHCVQNTVKKHKETRQYNDFPRTGRPKRVPNRGVRYLKRLVKDDGRLSATKITSDLNASLPKPVSTRTVRRYLRDLGYEYVVKIKRQWLSNKHRQQRVDWCTQYTHWTLDDWRKMIFSDESTFYVLKRKNQCKIWRLEQEKLLPEPIQQTNTGDGGKVGIWGGISDFGATAAKIYMENKDGKLYCDVLQHQLKHSMGQIPKTTKIFLARPGSLA